jgi:DNA-binding GntR family transcriptional regulator
MAKRSPAGSTADPNDRAGSETASVYARLRAMILGNDLQPGANVLLEDLAIRLGVSRTPIREALIRLEQEGLVEIKPRHGMRVLPVSIDDMREIYQLLTALEALAARLVAERGLLAIELRKLEIAVDQMDAALAADDLESWAKADTRFHELLVGYSGNHRLEAMVGGVVDQSQRVRRLTLKLRPKPVNSNADHRAVVEAIRKRDAQAAYRRHERHRSASGKMLIEILERLNLNHM